MTAESVARTTAAALIVVATIAATVEQCIRLYPFFLGGGGDSDCAAPLRRPHKSAKAPV